MGKKLDALLGRRGFKASKLKALLSLTVSRLAVLKHQRKVRCSNASGDIAELLRYGHHERAVLRAEYVIKEQNMLDVFAVVESYCNLLMERAVLLEDKGKECPDELREAISSLIFVASRTGELPELQHARYIFASRFGNEFAASAVELRNSCGVNLKIVQKMSTRQPSLESRLKVVKDLAAEKGIVLNLEEPSQELPPETPKEEEVVKQSMNNNHACPSIADPPATAKNSQDPEHLSGSMKGKEKFKDATTAAQAAFESAAYAAAAARAAVELSRSESQGKWSDDDHSSPRPSVTTLPNGRNQREGTKWSTRHRRARSPSSESEREGPEETVPEGEDEKKASDYSSGSAGTDSSESDDEVAKEPEVKHQEPKGSQGKNVLVFDTSESDDDGDDEAKWDVDIMTGSSGLRNRGGAEQEFVDTSNNYPAPPYRKPTQMRTGGDFGGGASDGHGAMTGSPLVGPRWKSAAQGEKVGRSLLSVRTRRGGF